MNAVENKGPLAGVKILDLTTVVMGPYATQILGDMGADIVKVESPAGDNMRWVGPMKNPGIWRDCLKVYELPIFLSALR